MVQTAYVYSVLFQWNQRLNPVLSFHLKTLPRAAHPQNYGLAQRLEPHGLPLNSRLF